MQKNFKTVRFMLGAIVGDIVGSVYERHNVKTTTFNLFNDYSRFTDDTVMTAAVAKWLCLNVHTHAALISCMQEYGRKYPAAGYGMSFRKWIRTETPEPYGSWGNGSAMRVSPVGLYSRTLDEVLELSKISAEVTHNHPEGIKGAQAIASAIFLLRHGADKAYIKNWITSQYGYDLERKLDDIRETYKFDVSCQGSVPEAIISFLEGNSFEEVLRLSISLGGDSDTIAAIACSLAACIYEIPEGINSECEKRLTDDIKKVIEDFNNICTSRSEETKVSVLNDCAHRRITPEYIETLKSNEVFVFGSNIKGKHGGGAARTAYRRFGAIWGQGEGLQGQSYAIPTMQGGIETIKPYVDKFIEFTKEHHELNFYVTKIGCGIAGFTIEEIAPLFKECYELNNIYLPIEFYKVIKEKR